MFLTNFLLRSSSVKSLNSALLTKSLSVFNTSSLFSQKEVRNLTSNSAISKDEGAEFRHLLRNSAFINLGDPEGKLVAGKIIHVVKDDLYIDFGWKFYCVCLRPGKAGHLYVRGANVLLKIKTLELSSKFLGAEKELTLLEADGSIVKLLNTPYKSS